HPTDAAGKADKAQQPTDTKAEPAPPEQRADNRQGMVERDSEDRPTTITPPGREARTVTYDDDKPGDNHPKEIVYPGGLKVEPDPKGGYNMVNADGEVQQHYKDVQVLKNGTIELKVDDDNVAYENPDGTRDIEDVKANTLTRYYHDGSSETYKDDTKEALSY